MRPGALGPVHIGPREILLRFSRYALSPSSGNDPSRTGVIVVDRIVECVPNFSEGRDRAVIDAIGAAIKSVQGVKLVNVDPGADFNRTVFTFVGAPGDVLEAAVRAARVGTSLIDMTKHKGEHPRNGALDVVPFIPIKGTTFEECDILARMFGERVWNELRIPVYLYARSARTPSRVRLPDIRKGEYEALPEKLKGLDFRPDIGEPIFVPRSGIIVTGTRQLLIAYNVNLDTGDKSIASAISGKIRSSGSFKTNEKGEKVLGPDGQPIKVPGYLKEVQAGGMMFNENIAQVSMNLLDYQVTNLQHAFEACREEAGRLGARVTGSEIVGLVPKEALLNAGRFYAGDQGPGPNPTDEALMKLAVSNLGLDQLYEFKFHEKVIDMLVEDEAHLANSSLKAFLDELASNSPAPGGGSVAALSGALGASLVEMVCELTLGKDKYKDAWEEMARASKGCKALRKRLLELVDEDTAAFNDVMSAFKLPKDTDKEKEDRSRAIQDGYKKAIFTPMETSRSCMEVLRMALPVSLQGNKSSISDVGVGAAMASTGFDGGAMNVRINLPSIKDEAFRNKVISELESMKMEKDGLMVKIMDNVNRSL